jgi:NTP pyrophosphatase (non-canonical NTP hydrolase)
MKLNDYQLEAASTAIYPKDRGLEYVALGLAGEAGEVANKVKKILRGDKVDMTVIADELGDVLWYVAAMANELGYDLKVIAQNNLLKLEKRRVEGKIQGEGDKR